jgi:carbohydrate kinase (thermoresistant glucokinase family)
MGVCGSGKSTVGVKLALRLDLPFIEGDDLHARSNVAKMAAGTPLTDKDRWPWLDEIGATLASSAPGSRGAVVACSVLRRAYRDRIRERASAGIQFVFLDGPYPILAARMRGRTGHFMPASLLDNQLATLERPTADEQAIMLDISRPTADLLGEALAAIAGRWASGGDRRTANRQSAEMGQEEPKT